MNFLTKASSQVIELFRTMTPGARITAGLLLVAIVVALAYLFRHQVTAGDEYLLGGHVFDQTEINRMTAAFATAGLTDWDDTGNRIRVPRSQKFSYLAALATDNALPKDFDSYFSDMLAQDNWFESNDQRRLRVQFLKEQQAAKMISAMKGIEKAIVKFAEPSTRGFDKQEPARATVAVQSAGSRMLDRQQIEAIRNSLDGFGVSPENVVVTDLGGATYPGRRADGMPEAEDHLYTDAKSMYEQLWQEKIQDMVSHYGAVKVGVNVVLDSTLNHTTQSREYKGQPTTLEASEFRKESASKKPGPGGRPGLEPNQGAPGNRRLTVDEVASSESTDSESRNDTRSVVGEIQETRQSAPLLPKFVSATIAIPESYFRKLWFARWRETNPDDAEEPKTPVPDELRRLVDEEKRKIEDQVVNLLHPVPPGDDKFSPVKVDTYADLPAPAPEEPGLSSTAMTWLAENWQTLGMIGVGLVCLVMLRGMVKSATTSPTPWSAGPAADLSLVTTEVPSAAEEPEDETGESAGKKRFRVSGLDLRQDLVDMVKEDPDAAANVLRGWIGEAA